jgi:hypothetical protein
MSSCQCDQLFAVGVKERAHFDDERAGVFLDQGRKGRIDVGFGSGSENEKLLRDSTRRCLDIFDPRSGNRIIRVDEGGDDGGIRYQFDGRVAGRLPTAFAIKTLPPIGAATEEPPLPSCGLRSLAQNIRRASS